MYVLAAFRETPPPPVNASAAATDLLGAKDGSVAHPSRRQYPACDE